MSSKLLTGDVYMIDTQRLAEQDRNFAEWRHNGSEYIFWENRKQKQKQLLSSLSKLKTQSELSQKKNENIILFDGTITTNIIQNNTINYPYVLRFVTNGMSAHNFGHVNHDILWPFIASYNLYHLFSERPNEPIYVIDIGLFLIKFLQLAYPERKFIGFRSINEVPLHCEEVLISGLGAPKYFDVNIIRYDEMNEVRRHMLNICKNYIQLNKLQINLSKIILEKRKEFLWKRFKQKNEIEDLEGSNSDNILRIIFIERNITKEFKEKNDERYHLDYEQDHPALRHYYDSGYWSHTVLTSKRVLGSDRRHILDFDNVLNVFADSFQTLYSNNYKKYHKTKLQSQQSQSIFFNKTKVEIIRFNPELYHYCEQVHVISTGNVSIKFLFI